MSGKAYKPPRCVKCWVKGRMDNRCWCPSECAPDSLHRSCSQDATKSEPGTVDRRGSQDDRCDDFVAVTYDGKLLDCCFHCAQPESEHRRASNASGLGNAGRQLPEAEE